MKPVRYPETIFCEKCNGHVRMLDCRALSRKSKGHIQVEFDYLCVECGTRASAVRDAEFLQFSEREFCQKQGLPEFKAKAKGVGVIVG